MTADMLFWEVAKLFFASFLGAYFLQHWKFGAEDFNHRCDELHDLVKETAEKSLDYWTNDAPPDEKERIKQEIVLLSMMYRVLGLAAIVCEGLSSQEKQRIDRELGVLNDAVTGGDFRSPERRSDHNRALQAFDAASSISILIRRGRRRALTGLPIPIRWKGAIRSVRDKIARFPSR